MNKQLKVEEKVNDEMLKTKQNESKHEHLLVSLLYLSI